MKKLILILFVSLKLFSQEVEEHWFFTQSSEASYSLPVFSGVDTTKLYYSPYSDSYLRFDGVDDMVKFPHAYESNPPFYNRGMFCPMNVKDSCQIDIWFRFYPSGNTGTTVMSCFANDGGGVYTGFELIHGGESANKFSWYWGLHQSYPFTIATTDTTWYHASCVVTRVPAKTIRLYWQDTLVLTTNPFNAFSSSFPSSAWAINMTLGGHVAFNSVADTLGWFGTAPRFKGEIKGFKIRTYESGVDSLYAYGFPGYGIHLIDTANNWAQVYRYDRTSALHSTNAPNTYGLIGMLPTYNKYAPIWVNTGTPPTFIDSVKGGTWSWIRSGDVPNSDTHHEPYLNAGTAWRDSFIVVGAHITDVNVTSSATFGDSAYVVAKYNLNTSVWSKIANTYPNNNVVTACQFQGNLVAGGIFTTVGATVDTGITFFNGTSYSVPDSGLNGSVYFVKNDNDTILDACGLFTGSGRTTGLNNIARYNGTSWRGYGTGTDGAVWTTIYYNGSKYFGGQFSTANGVSANSFARWTGSTFQAYGTGIKYITDAFGYVDCFAVYRDTLFIGGEFDSAGGIAAKSIARFYNGSYSTFADFTAGSDRATIIDMEVETTHNVLIVCGTFTKVNGKKAGRVAIWNGRQWITSLWFDMRPEEIIITATGRIFVGGDAHGANGVKGVCIFEVIPTWQ